MPHPIHRSHGFYRGYFSHQQYCDYLDLVLEQPCTNVMRGFEAHPETKTKSRNINVIKVDLDNIKILLLNMAVQLYGFDV